MGKSERPRPFHSRCSISSNGYEWVTPDPAEVLPGYAHSVLTAADWQLTGKDSHPHWPSDLNNPVLTAKGSDYDPYDPTRRRGLLERFMGLPYEIQEIDRCMPDYLEFANRYGLLGERQLAFNSPGHGTRFGESVRYWREQICILTRLKRIYDLLGTGGEDAIDELDRYVSQSVFVTLRNDVFDYEQIESYGFRSHVCFNEGLASSVLDRSRRIRGTAYLALHAQLNRRVAELMSPGIDPFGNHVQLVAANLLGAIYVQFAYSMLGQPRQIKFCEREGCQEVVQRKRSSAKYCSEECQEAQKEIFRLRRQSQAKKSQESDA